MASAGYGKQKGSSFEREMCKTLSLWISDKQHDNLLWRSAMSGGRSTLALNRGEVNATQAGDISAITAMGEILTKEFFIECKHYLDLDITGFFLNRGGKLSKFWSDTVSAAQKNGKKPMLIAKQNYVSELVMLPYQDYSPIRLITETDPVISIATTKSSQRASVYLLADFLSAFKITT